MAALQEQHAETLFVILLPPLIPIPCACHDVVKTPDRIPVQPLLRPSGIGHQRRRVSCPPRRDTAAHGFSGDLLHSLDNLEDRIPLTSSQIDGEGFAALLELL